MKEEEITITTDEVYSEMSRDIGYRCFRQALLTLAEKKANVASTIIYGRLGPLYIPGGWEGHHDPARDLYIFRKATSTVKN